MNSRRNRQNEELKGQRTSRPVSPRLRCLLVLATALLGALALLPAAAQAYTYVPADPPRPCDPTVAPCDVELEVVNDRGIPQRAGLILAADVADPNFYLLPGAAPVDYYSKRGVLAFNFSSGRFTGGPDCSAGSWYPCRQYRFPLPPGVSLPSGNFQAVSFPINPGTAIYISRESYLEGQMDKRELFPEKVGQLWTVASAGYRGQIVLPSFGAPRNPDLAPRERGVLGLLNDLRVANGAGRLRAQPDLNAAADNYACWLREHLRGPEAPDSITPDLHYAFGTPSRRALDAGWMGRSSVGENISFNPLSPESGYWWLLNSPGHRANMLDAKYSYIGLAFNCGITVMKLAAPAAAGADAPHGGWGDDVGDSSLAQWDEDWELDPGDGSGNRRFRPGFSVLRKTARRPVLLVKANRQAKGTMTIRYRGRVKSSGPLSARVKVGRSGRINIRFKAAAGSAIRSGTVVRCLKTKKGRVLVRGCRKR